MRGVDKQELDPLQVFLNKSVRVLELGLLLHYVADQERRNHHQVLNPTQYVLVYWFQLLCLIMMLLFVTANYYVVEQSQLSFFIALTVQQVEQLHLHRVIFRSSDLVLEKELLSKYRDQRRELEVEFLVNDGELTRGNQFIVGSQ